MDFKYLHPTILFSVQNEANEKSDFLFFFFSIQLSCYEIFPKHITDHCTRELKIPVYKTEIVFSDDIT